MPHFGIVDESRMEPRDAMLLRAKVHLRSARRRIREGYIKEAVATLQDAADSAMSWYAMDSSNRARFDVRGDENLDDAAVLCAVLHRAGVISDAGVFGRLTEAAEGMLEGEIAVSDVDSAAMLSDTEKLLTELGVLPFDEAELPPEHPGLKR